MDSSFVNLARDLAMFAKDTFSNIAPEVWEMTMRKIVAGAYLKMGGGIIVGIVGITSGIFATREKEGVSIFICLIIFAIAISIFCPGFLEWYSVDYYTLKAIMELVH